ncbi:ankyrin repeat-containing domain protein [Mycena galopus ATCC 62051]|nr:ankyrin repeat-containing domain protein [Mycena galopus ATCC 62051]
MIVKLLGLHGEEMAARAYARKGRATALDYAASCGHLEIVGLLAPICMPSAPDTSHRNYLSVALGKSAMAGQLEIFKYLVSEGAAVNFLDPLGNCSYSPLSLAAGVAKKIVLVQFLLASGASPNLRCTSETVPLFAAADVDIAQALLRAGADIHATDQASRNVLGHIDNIELLRLFLEHGADPTHENENGESALHYICGKSGSGQDAVEPKRGDLWILRYGGGQRLWKSWNPLSKTLVSS